jgi:hypothetical protein
MKLPVPALRATTRMCRGQVLRKTIDPALRSQTRLRVRAHPKPRLDQGNQKIVRDRKTIAIFRSREIIVLAK